MKDLIFFFLYVDENIQYQTLNVHLNLQSHNNSSALQLFKDETKGFPGYNKQKIFF